MLRSRRRPIGPRCCGRFGGFEPLESRQLLSADVVINEIHYDPLDRDIPSEFIELYNRGTEAVNLSGWKFTEGIDFTFPPGTAIAPDRYVVIAQDQAGYETEFGQVRGTNVIAYQIEEGARGNQSFEGSLGMDFVVHQPVRVTQLGVFDSNSGGLRRTIVAQLWSRNDNATPGDPVDDTGVGIVADAIFTADDPGELVGGSRFKPLAEPPILQPGAYTIVAFGYGSREGNFNGEGDPAGSTDTGGGLLSFVGRSRFGDAGSFPDQVDTGPANRYGAGTFRFDAVDPLPPFADPAGVWTGKLANDGEEIVLQDASGNIVDEVTYRIGFPWPTGAQGEGPSLELLNAALDNDLAGSWRSSLSPTPGLRNSVFTQNAGPQLRQVRHDPRQPVSGQDVTITAKVTDPDGVSRVTLDYQLVDPGSYIRLTDDEYATSWTSVIMTDDGTGEDQASGDGIFTVVLPGSLQTHRRLVRYRITAADQRDATVTVPYADDPQPNFAYFVYDGIPSWTGADRPGQTQPVTYSTDVMDSLPAYHLIAQASDVEDSQYRQAFNGVQFQATLVYDGIVYDHVRFNNRGQFSTYVSGKNKWKLHFNRGHEFQARDDYGRQWAVPVRDLNFGTAASPWARPNRGLAGMDEALAFKFFNLAGVAAPNISAFQLRVIDDPVEADPDDQYEGDLWGLYLAFEDPDGRFLDQHGLPDGSLFRMQSGNIEIRHRGIGLPDDLSDLRAFTSSRTGYNKTGPIQPVEWWRENVDLDTYYSYRAVIEAVNHSDLRDQENSFEYFNAQTGKWTQLPWDLDLLYEEFDRWGPDGVQTNTPLEQFRKALEHEEINIEFQSRLREMQDLLFNPDQAWQAVEEYARYVEPFAAVDRAMWDYNPRTSSIHRGFFYRSPAPYHGGAAGLVRRELTSPDFEGMINWVKQFIVSGGFGGDQLAALHADPDIPQTPTIGYTGGEEFPINRLQFETTSFHDPQGDDTFAAIQWRIGEVTVANAPNYDPQAPVHYEVTPVWESGELEVFQPRIAVDASGLQVGHAYRARVRTQDDTGRWSHWSEPIEFIAGPPVVDAVHNLRVSEVNYNPHPPLVQFGEANVDNDQFEFVEVVNTGTEPIDLGGVRFVQITTDGEREGIEFTFAPQSLAAGQRIVVPKDRAAFVSRYGAAVRLAEGSGDAAANGQFAGSLANGGERLTLLDARGGTIQSFVYDDRGDWPGRADGNGSSLEVVDVDGDYNDPANWRGGSEFGGSPGVAGLGVDKRIVVNEVLARTQLPSVDRVELYNTTADSIDLGHWYLSDSNDNYIKFQFAEPTPIAPGQYLVLDQQQLGFGFSGTSGDDVWLIEADSRGKPVRFVDHVEFGGVLEGVSLGRWPDGIGPLVPMAEPTFGRPNAGRVLGDANDDGQFNTLDLDAVLQFGTYLSDVPATRSQGDFNGDGRFNQLDVVAALQANTFRGR